MRPVNRITTKIDFAIVLTVEQDPLFGFRIIVDIASKALSPAINDPTTAVLAIDQIHHLLRLVGGRRLDDGEARDARARCGWFTARRTGRISCCSL